MHDSTSNLPAPRHAARFSGLLVATLLSMGALGGCASATVEQRLCDNIMDQGAECTPGMMPTDADHDACVADFEQLARDSEAVSCGDPLSAMYECYASAAYVCGPDGPFPACQPQEAAWRECCSRDGMTCPRID